jgi:hypothetical protein
MNEDLVAVRIPPGLYRSGTKYQASGRWYDANGIRFFENTIQAIGGWRYMLASDGSSALLAIMGLGRAITSWRVDNGDTYFVRVTTHSIDAVVGATAFAVSPWVNVMSGNVAPWPPTNVRVTAGSLATVGALSVGATSITIAATAVTGTIKKNDAIGLGAYQYYATAAVTFAGNSATIPIRPPITAGSGGYAPGTAAFPTPAILYDSGTSTGAGAYGAGNYGLGNYGTGQLGGTPVDADTFQLAVFGSYLAFVCTVDHTLYVWRGNTSVRAYEPTFEGVTTLYNANNVRCLAGAAAGSPTIPLTIVDGGGSSGVFFAGESFQFVGDSTVYTILEDTPIVANLATLKVSPSVVTAIPGNTYAQNTDNIRGIPGAGGTGVYRQAPKCNAVVVTPERFLVALGAGGVGRRVQWADRESISKWGPLPINQAGSYDLKTNGTIACGRWFRNNTLIWTDTDLHAMTFIGGQYVYRFDRLGEQCGIISPNAVALTGTKAIWMGQNSFFYYDGSVQSLPSDVADYIFSDLNYSQRVKVWAVPVPAYGEVWWFYPGQGSLECNKYVIYSERENHFSFGALPRMAGCSTGPNGYPIYIARNDGPDYPDHSWSLEHEYQSARSAQGTPLIPYLESGPLELGNGDTVMKALRMVADSSAIGGSADLKAYLYYSMFPGQTEGIAGPYALTSQPQSVRAVGKIHRIRLEENNQVAWRTGIPRLAAMPVGRR